MTTFATSHTSFSNMQGEDFMEVSNDPDRNNAMTMEEDNYDLDLDLGDDVPQPELTHEDSRMSDDGEGHEGDQDLQMHEDDHDQDDEILDDVNDEPEILEVPMTEETADSQQEQQTHIQSLPNPDVVPETPAFASFTSQPPVGSLFTEANKSQDGQPGGQESNHPHLSNTEDEGEHLSLFDVETGTGVGFISHPPTGVNDGAPLAAEQTGVEDVHPQEPGSEPQPESNETEFAHVDHYNDDDAIPPVPEDDFEEPSTTTDNVAGTGAIAQPENSTQDPAPEATEQDEQDPAHAELENGDDEHATNYLAEPMPCLVTYREHQMSLFPPLTQEGTPDQYLLADSSIFDETIKTFLDACHTALAVSLEKTEDLEVAFPCFSFKFSKHDPEASSFTLRHIAELHAQFQQQDGVDTPEPLHVQLVVCSPLTARMNYLYDLAKEGKGLKYVEDILRPRSGEDAGPHLGEYDQVDETNPEETGEEHEWAAGEDEYDEEYGDDAADAGVPETDHRWDESLGKSAGAVEGASQAGGPADENDTEAFASAVPAHETPVVPASNPQEENLEVEGTGADPDEDPGKDAQTAEEIDFDDEEWAQDESTNTENPGAADAQEEPHIAVVEPSQSWHSATQPDASESNDKDQVHDEPATDLAVPDGNHPDPSDASSATLQGAAGDHPPEVTENPNEEEEDIFADEDTYTPTNNPDLDDEDFIDFGDDEQAKSPSLKRDRSEVDKVGGEADDDEGDYIDWDAPTPAKKQKLTDPAHPLKRSRSENAK